MRTAVTHSSISLLALVESRREYIERAYGPRPRLGLGPLYALSPITPALFGSRDSTSYLRPHSRSPRFLSLRRIQARTSPGQVKAGPRLLDGRKTKKPLSRLLSLGDLVNIPLISPALSKPTQDRNTPSSATGRLPDRRPSGSSVRSFRSPGRVWSSEKEGS